MELDRSSFSRDLMTSVLIQPWHGMSCRLVCLPLPFYFKVLKKLWQQKINFEVYKLIIIIKGFMEPTSSCLSLGKLRKGKILTLCKRKQRFPLVFSLVSLNSHFEYIYIQLLKVIFPNSLFAHTCVFSSSFAQFNFYIAPKVPRVSPVMGICVKISISL